MALDKKIRSLKRVVPSPAELQQERERIWLGISQVDWNAKVKCPDPKWLTQPIIEKITKKLWPHIKPGISRNRLFNQVVIGSFVGPYPDPKSIAEITNDLASTTKKLHKILGRLDFPPNYVFRISRGSVETWNIFVECLERATEITYEKPPKNEKPIQRSCVISAYDLITKYTIEVPAKTRGGLFYAVAGLIYQINNPAADDGNDDKLKAACDRFLDLVRDRGYEGAVRNRDRW